MNYNLDILKAGIKECSYEEYLRYFNIEIQCKSLEDLYGNLSTHTTSGEFTDSEDDSISASYWDYAEEDIKDVILDKLSDGLICDLVKIDNRYFEIPEAYRFVEVKVWKKIQKDGEFRDYYDNKSFYNAGDLKVDYDSTIDFDFEGDEEALLHCIKQYSNSDMYILKFNDIIIENDKDWLKE
ncbi:MAG: hypothetical protein IJP63_06080 [Acholeplasmatales bacterium]|nr:hypothetical protein [Acholeplasmatales bacterium]